MFLFKWIKEYFAIYILGLLFISMGLFSVVSPSGLVGFGIFLLLEFFLIVLWGLFVGVIGGPLYIIVFRPGLAIAVKAPLIILRILIHIFIATPLKFMGHSSSWVWKGFEGSIGNMIAEDEENGKRKPKIRYVAIFLFFLIGLTYIVGVDIETFAAMMRDATILAIPLMFVPLILTLIVSGIGVKLSGRSLGETAEQSYDDRINAVDKGKEIGESAVGIYKDLDHINKHRKAIEGKGIKEGLKHAAKEGRHAQRAAMAGEKADEFVNEARGISKIAGNLEELPVVGEWLADLAAGTAGGTAIVTLLVILVALIIIWLIVAIFFLFIFGGIMYAFVFPFLESAFGVAGAYGADIGGVLGSGPDASLNAPSAEFNALKLAGARMQCMLEGPQCMNEWRQNNTERPGSESVGTQFGLEIEDFNVNSGLTLDISTRNQDETIPVQFDVYNPIRNLRGIDARDVQYRVAVDGGSETSCTSEWKDLGGQFVGDQDNMIPRGGFARPGSELDDLTLKNCGALQPGSRQSMEAELQIKYDYSSQSTLQFQAMEQSHMLDESIRPEPTQSETADTPVKTYVNVQSPITFRNPEEGGGRDPLEFPVWVGFETDRFDLEYQVIPNDLTIHSSSLLADVDRVSPSDFDVDTDEDDEFSSSCEDLEHVGDSEYRLNESYQEGIIDSQDRGNWYSRGLGPSAAECSMVLAPDTINSVSETGETLSMRVDGNYTVRLSSNTQSFEVTNNRCRPGGANCPYITTQNESEAVEGKISSVCSTSVSVEATDGCTVLENTNEWASQPSVINSDNSFSESIENRHRAYYLGNVVDEIESNAPDGEDGVYRSFRTEQFEHDAAVGLELDPDEIGEISGRMILYIDSRDGSLEIIEDETIAYCEGASREDILTQIESEQGIQSENVLYVRAGLEEDGFWREVILHERFENC